MIIIKYGVVMGAVDEIHTVPAIVSHRSMIVEKDVFHQRAVRVFKVESNTAPKNIYQHTVLDDRCVGLDRVKAVAVHDIDDTVSDYPFADIGDFHGS